MGGADATGKQNAEGQRRERQRKTRGEHEISAFLSSSDRLTACRRRGIGDRDRVSSDVDERGASNLAHNMLCCVATQGFP
jgi:hypothetical protein